MRYLKIIFLTSFLVSVLSCSKEDNKTYAELILGKWNIVNQIVKEKSSGTSDTTTFNALSNIDFSSNGAVLFSVDNDENGIIESNETQTTTYLLKNGNLTFGLNDSLIYTIKTLTNSNFFLQADEGDYQLSINLKR